MILVVKDFLGGEYDDVFQRGFLQVDCLQCESILKILYVLYMDLDDLFGIIWKF